MSGGFQILLFEYGVLQQKIEIAWVTESQHMNHRYSLDVGFIELVQETGAFSSFQPSTYLPMGILTVFLAKHHNSHKFAILQTRICNPHYPTQKRLFNV